MSADRLENWRAGAVRLVPGLVLAGTVAAAAGFLGSHYGAPVMLFALLIGMAFNFLHAEGPCREGVDLAAKFILRLGVGLLGVRIALDDLGRLGGDGALVLDRTGQRKRPCTPQPATAGPGQSHNPAVALRHPRATRTVTVRVRI